MPGSGLQSGHGGVETGCPVIGRHHLGHPAPKVFTLANSQGNFLAIHQGDGVGAVVALPNLVQMDKLAVVYPHEFGVVDEALHILEVLGDHQPASVGFVDARITATGLHV